MTGFSFLKKKNIIKGAVSAPVFAILFSIFLMFPVLANKTTDELQHQINQAKDEKKQTQNALEETRDSILGMEGSRNALQGKLHSLNSDLEEVSDNLERLEQDISEKNNEIENTQKALEEAQATADWQYDCMKKRIKFIYERQNSSYMEMFFASNGLADFLNKQEYVEKISAYDKKMLESYRQTREEIAQEEQQLEKEKEELDELHEETVKEQARVSELIKNTSNSIAGYADEIAKAEFVADAYEAKVAQQEQNIKELQKQLQEELAKSRLAAQSRWRDISEVSFAEGDRELLAQLIYCEAGGEPYAGKVAVGAVVINRVLSSVYPDTVVNVIYQRKQFEPVSTGRLALALANHKANAACYQAADEAMAGNTNVGNCVYFRTPIPGLTGIAIGGHIFY